MALTVIKDKKPITMRITINKLKCIWAHIRWFLIVVPLGVLGILTTPYMFPLAWLCRNSKFNLFWFWLSDLRLTPTGYSRDYQIFLDRKNLTKETFGTAYNWSVRRNRMGNLLNLIKVPSSSFKHITGNNNIEITKLIINDLHQYDGTKIHQDTPWEARAEIKYLPDNATQDIWQVNTGEIQSNKTSIIGTGYILYKIGNWHSFRYSSVKRLKIKLFKKILWERNVTIWMGTNNSVYMLAFKLQKIKPWNINN